MFVGVTGFRFIDDVRHFTTRGRAVYTGSSGVHHFRVRLDEVVLIVGADLSKLQQKKMAKIK